MASTPLLLALVGVAAATTRWHELDGNYTFEAYETEFGKSYTAAERPRRQEVFAANLRRILQHNAEEVPTYKLGVNKFADMTSEEFKEYYRGYNGNSRGRPVLGAMAPDFTAVPTAALPDAVDWRKQGKVTPVKDQGGCGSCWAFSATETLESHIAIKTGKLIKMSPQQITSCTPNPRHCGGTGGCDGATQWLAFNYTLTAGITSEDDYPYHGVTGQCDTSKIKPVAGIKGYVRLPTNNYTMLLNAVAQIGPMAVSAAAEPWQLYEEGIFSENCGADIDHGIQAVGYGTAKFGTKDYWLIRNSWGADWGEDGYIRLQRTHLRHECETDRTPEDGGGCPGGPKSIQVCGQCGILSDSSYPTGGYLEEA